MSNSTIRVFLADDHVLFREGLTSLLAKALDIVVIGECGDGRDALSQILEMRPDVVVLDITLPRLNGLDVCWELNRKLPNIAVLILSMHGNDECVREAMENGASGYLCKDAPADMFTQAIYAVSRGGTFLGPGLSRDIWQNPVRQCPSRDNVLTRRERQVLQLIAEGKTNKQIAQELSVAFKTIDTHRTNLMQKLDIHSQTDLVKYALRKGFVPLD